jgi:ribosomal-protein-alanine N-acetyltransferase
VAFPTLRRALPSDVAKLIALERSCADAPHWSEETWTGLLSDEGNESARVCFLIETGDVPAGFVVVQLTLDVAEIENVAVRKSLRRQGIGRRLCIEAMTWARSRLAETIELEVRASSAGAIGLYTSLGFEASGRRREYYRDPTDDAILMASALRL